MNSLLSAVSGHFGKTLVFGTLLPVILFGLLGWLLLGPYLPPDATLLTGFAALDLEWKIAVATFAALLAAGILQSLNTPIIRLYEGYPWKKSWLGRWLVRRGKADYRALGARWQGLRTLLYARTPPPGLEQRRQDLIDRWRAVGLAVNQEFPGKEGSVLPTRLGNTIRSFESYPSAQYKMDAIVLWPRLQGKVPTEYAALVTESKTAFDFTIHAAALAAVLAGSLVVTGLIHPVPLATVSWTVGWLLAVAFAASLAYFFYVLSIGRALAWGAMVKGAFDLYRNDLLKGLGYEWKPATRREEREIWEAISVQMLYGDSPKNVLPSYLSQKRFARCKPLGPSLELTRGIEASADPQVRKVTLRVVNRDTVRPAEEIVLHDFLPAGFEYRWGSAAASRGSVEVSGTNPYRFAVVDLTPRSSLEVTYEALAHDSPEEDTP